MRFGIVAKPEIDDKGIELIKTLIKEIRKAKEEFFLEECLGKKIGIEGLPLRKLDVDILITFGGDGTILRSLQECNSKIFGINAGIMGFLTEVEPNQALVGLRRILAGDYEVEKRIKLKVVFNGKRQADATNDVVMHTSTISELRHFEIFVDDAIAQKIRADGVIVATPTGSTGYAMSVGGPLIDPRVKSFVIAPIAPYTTSAKPMIVPSKAKIEIRITDKKSSVMIIDGGCKTKVGFGDILSFTESEKNAEFVRLEANFYEKMKEKMSKRV